MKRLAILGSTGSIGKQTLEVVREFPDRFEVVALACGRNIPLLKEQVAEFKPHLVTFNQVETNDEISDVNHLSLDEIACHPEIDFIVVATSGSAGLSPTLAAIRSGKTVALANKEVLVMAGDIVMSEAQRYKTDIIPVDSEHSAIWQCLNGESKKEISKIILTASGGPFKSRDTALLSEVTPEEALNHPTWQMGVKVTIDSATLMNKGMEIIEAHWLFGVPFSRIEVLIHPQSIVHSMVEFVDGSTKAQLSMPDMRLPIQYALTHPERWEDHFHNEMNLGSLGALEFEPVDLDRYPCLRLASDAGEKGRTYPAVLCAADDEAVSLFLNKRIGFLDIAALVARTLDLHKAVENPTIEEIVAADVWARETVRASVEVAG